MTMTEGSVAGRRKTVVLAVIALIAILAGGGVFAIWWMHRPVPFGMDKRIVWTTSKVVGTPEPPDPYVTEPAFPALKFKNPVEIGFLPGGNRVFVFQHDGKLFSFPNANAADRPDLAIDLAKLPNLDKAHFPDMTGFEARSFTFDPNYATNHFCYLSYFIHYPDKPAREYAKMYPQFATASRISRFTVGTQDPPTLDPTSEQVIITWPGREHNGGCVKFGPDGDLYFSTGDNGDPNPPDPFNVGQNVGDIRAKILRIDVNHASEGKAYSIPPDNPFVNLPDARGEVYAFGLRNPWRFSFDRQSGDIFAGDVGWELWESVDHVTKGGNYGWSITEGPQPVHPNGKLGPSPITPPDIALPHTEAASLTGGYVYHGKRLPELQNQYLFGDWETRRLWAAPFDGKKLGKHRTIAQTDLRIVSFGEDADGEIYIVDYEGGGIHRIAPNPNVGSERSFPRKLSQTGLFANVSEQQPNPGVVAYNINTPQWVDDSTSVRFIAVPSENAITEGDDGKLNFPKNTVLVRTLSLPMAVGDEATRKKIETQLLHFDGRQWHGYSYQWDSNQSDATLVDGNGLDVPLTVIDPATPGGRQQVWHFNSRAQCMTCHTTWTHYAMGFNAPQLDRTEQYQVGHSLVSDNQLRSLRRIGLLPEPKAPEASKDGSPPKPAPAPVVMVNPYEDDNGHSLDERARSYLAVNCSVCHRFGGGGTALIDLTIDKSLKDMHLFNPPMLGTFNLPDAQVICPGDPSRSVLFYRMAKSGLGRMPHLGSTVIDDKGLLLISKWIEGMGAAAGSASLSQEAAQTRQTQDAAVQSLQHANTADGAVAAADKLLATTDGALKLLAAVNDGRVQAGYRGMIASRAMASPQDTVRDLFSRFAPTLPGATPKLGPNPDIDKLLALTGDVERGRKIFFELNGGLCAKCHIIGDKGTDFGPNLSQIGAKYNRADMLDNILHPSKTIAQGYETYVVRTKSKQSYIGFLVSKSDTEVVIKDQIERKLVTLKPDDIDKLEQQHGADGQPLSAMPEGMISELEPQQAADLLEYLVTRK